MRVLYLKCRYQYCKYMKMNENILHRFTPYIMYKYSIGGTWWNNLPGLSPLIDLHGHCQDVSIRKRNPLQGYGLLQKYDLKY